jgi:hypothetical protein
MASLAVTLPLPRSSRTTAAGLTEGIVVGPGSSARNPSTVTFRAFSIGILCALFIAGFGYGNDWILDLERSPAAP